MVTNQTAHAINLGGGISLSANEAETVSNQLYLDDTDLRGDINTLYAAGTITVSGGPVGFPVRVDSPGVAAYVNPGTATAGQVATALINAGLMESA